LAIEAGFVLSRSAVYSAAAALLLAFDAGFVLQRSGVDSAAAALV